MLRKPGAEPSLRPEEQHENQARHDRRYGERQIDEGYEQTLARKIEFGDRPGCGKAQKHVERYADGRDQKGDRKRVVSGKSVSVRVDLGGRRLIKKKKKSRRKI